MSKGARQRLLLSPRWLRRGFRPPRWAIAKIHPFSPPVKGSREEKIRTELSDLRPVHRIGIRPEKKTNWSFDERIAGQTPALPYVLRRIAPSALRSSEDRASGRSRPVELFGMALPPPSACTREELVQGPDEIRADGLSVAGAASSVR